MAQLRSGIALAKSPAAQRIGWAVAVAIFVGGLVLSVRARPELVAEIDLRLFLLLVFGFCPFSIAVSAAVFRVSGTIAGVDFCWREAFRLTVLSSALNHLPLPGGVILRVGAMRARGADLLAAGAVNLAGAFLWLGFSFVYAGLWALALAPLFAAAMIAGGVLSVAVGAAATWRVRKRLDDVIILAGLNVLLPIGYSVGLWIGFLALGVGVSFPAACVVSAAGVIGSAASFMPAGLGAREAAGAFLAYVIGVDAFSAFTATALVHVAVMAALGLCALCFSLTAKPK